MSLTSPPHCLSMKMPLFCSGEVGFLNRAYHAKRKDVLVVSDARVHPTPTPLGSDAMSPSSAAAASLSGKRLSKRQSWRGDDLDGTAAKELQVNEQTASLTVQKCATPTA